MFDTSIFMYGTVFETVGDCVFDPVFKCVLCDDIQPVFDFGLSESNGTGRALSVSVFDKWHDNCLSGFTDLSCGSTWNSTGIFPGNGENG